MARIVSTRIGSGGVPGEILQPAAWPVVGGDTWRCNFDLRVEGNDPVDLRLFLKDAKGALTETWIYQFTP